MVKAWRGDRCSDAGERHASAASREMPARQTVVQAGCER